MEKVAENTFDSCAPFRDDYQSVATTSLARALISYRQKEGWL